MSNKSHVIFRFTNLMRTLESTIPPSPLEPQSNTTGEDWGMTLVCVDMLGEPWFFTAEMQPLLAT